MIGDFEAGRTGPDGMHVDHRKLAGMAAGRNAGKAGRRFCVLGESLPPGQHFVADAPPSSGETPQRPL
jgi:hypothetical protein